MLRLFKILIVATLLAGIYFYLQHTPFITTTWARAEISNGISLAFPKTARQHTRSVHNTSFGKTQLDVFDYIDTNEAFICLRIRPQHDAVLHKNLEQLFEQIRQLNDTADTQVTLKKQFIYHGYPAYEYQADKPGQQLLVRLLKINGEIFSLIYVTKEQTNNARQAEIFFNSLKL